MRRPTYNKVGLFLIYLHKKLDFCAKIHYNYSHSNKKEER